MDNQINLPFLGKLRILEVYEFYDIPRLFLCRNASGQHFLALSVMEQSESNVFLFVSISGERIKAIIRHEVDLRSIFQLAEDDFVYKIEFHNSREHHVETVECAQIPEDWLPAKDEFISPRIEITEYLVKAVNQ